MARRREELEQRIIEHEARLSRARATIDDCLARQQARRERGQAAAETEWVREQIISMIAGAEGEQELEGLGLSDEVVRELELGSSLREVWIRYRPALPRLPT